MGSGEEEGSRFKINGYTRVSCARMIEIIDFWDKLRYSHIIG